MGEAAGLIIQHDNCRGETSGGTKGRLIPQEKPCSGGLTRVAVMVKCEVAWWKDSAVWRAPPGEGSPEGKRWHSEMADLGKCNVFWQEHARGDHGRVRIENGGQWVSEGAVFHPVKRKYLPNPAIARYQLVRSLCTKKA